MLIHKNNMIFFDLLLPILTYSINGKHFHSTSYKSNNCKGISNTNEYKINECISFSNDQYVYIECNGDNVEVKIYNESLCNEDELMEIHEYSEGHCYGKKKYECVGSDHDRLLAGKILGGIIMMMIVCFCLFSVIGSGRNSYNRSYSVHRRQEPEIQVLDIRIQSNVNLNDEGL